MLDKDWALAVKKEDPDFEGSLWQKLGYDSVICPECEAHLRKGICLNACHLSTGARGRLAKLMGDARN